MAVGWSQNPYVRPTAPPFAGPEDDFGFQNPFPGGLPSVGDPTSPVPGSTPSMFEPGDPNGMFGNNPGGQPTQPGNPVDGQQPDGNWPTQGSIDRRRRLAEALMGQKMEVNHPMQAVANAVSQIAGAWMAKKADSDEESNAKRRRDLIQGSLNGDVDIDKVMEAWLKSGDPELVDRALDWKLKKASAQYGENGAPVTRNFYEGGNVVTKQWNPQTKQWENVGDPAPRWKTDQSGGDPEYTNPVEVDPTTAGPAGPGGTTDPQGTTTTEPQEKVFKTPGPLGKRSMQQGPTLIGPNGEPIRTVFNPNDGNTYYQGPDGGWRMANTQTKAPQMMTEPQFQKLQLDRQDEINGLNALNKYFKTVKDLPTGYRRWANDLTARFKTWLGQNNLTPDQFNQMDARAKVNALLGMFRVTIVGPGVMTEYDAERILMALGGDPASALQNPEVLAAILGDLYERKLQRARILQKTYERQMRARGQDPDPLGVPDVLGGDAPQPGGNAPPPGGNPQSTQRPPPQTPRGPKGKVVLPPVSSRVIGKTTYTAPNGKTYVWGRDAQGKIGWVER